MIRYLRLWRELFITCLLREMLFRANFIAILATSSWWFVMNVVMFQVIFGHVTEIAGWTKYEIFFLVGTSHATFGIFETLFMVNMTRIPDLIRTGELDFYLLKPVSTQFLISARYADFEAVPNTIVGFLFVAWCAAKLHAVFSWTALATFALFVVNGVTLYYTLLFVSVTISFWFMRFHAMNIWWQLTSLARQPAEVFPPALRFVLTYCLPMLVIVNFPVKAYLGRLPLAAGIWALVATGLLLALSQVFFTFALRRYRSASS
ncbi:MAG: ABC-2 family transporter protein [Candidatus Coatesbacteria bacterium]